jgi:alpha-galactosidase
MAILYYDEKKLFQLNTENTTYVIGLSPEGYVGHVYYGPLLHGEPDLYPLRMDEPPPRPSIRERNLRSSTVFQWNTRPEESAITVRAV